MGGGLPTRAELERGYEMLIRKCLNCKEDREAVAIEIYANGLYGYYCLECNNKEDERDYREALSRGGK